MILPLSLSAVIAVLFFVVPGWSYRKSIRKWKSNFFETKYDEWISVFAYSLFFCLLSYVIMRFIDPSSNQKIYDILTFSNSNMNLEGKYLAIFELFTLANLLSYLLSNLVCFFKMPAFVNMPTTDLFFDNANLDLYEAYPLLAKRMAKFLNKKPKSGDYSISIVRMNNGDTHIGITILFSQESKFAEKDILIVPLPEKIRLLLPEYLQNTDHLFWQRQYIPFNSISSIKNVYLDDEVSEDLTQSTHEVDSFRERMGKSRFYSIDSILEEPK